MLAALLLMPTLPAAAEENTTVSAPEVKQVCYNTGDLDISVIDPSVSENEAYQSQWMDFFEEDGSYTINIPEANPFFPYEVQFTCNGETTREWFMNPEDTVEIGGHTFRVSAYFDNTVVTQMSLNVAGKQVTVYPEEKKFTNDGSGVAELSLLPVEERYLTVDLRGFSPVELTQVSTNSVFTGNDALTATDKIAWTYYGDDNYTINQSGDCLNLSYGMCYGNMKQWTMYAGSANQLDTNPDTNLKYIVSIMHDTMKDWLSSALYTQDTSGKRTQLATWNEGYSDYASGDQYFSMYYEWINYHADKYLGFQIKDDYAKSTVKVYEGKWTTAADAEAGTEITTQILTADLTAANTGYKLENSSDKKYITFVSYGADGRANGCLPIELEIYSTSSGVNFNLYSVDGNTYLNTVSNSYWTENSVNKHIMTLYKEDAVDATYGLRANYHGANGNSADAVTAAYQGHYDSIAAAEAAGAENIKEKLFNSAYGKEMFTADFSKGVDFTCFVGADGDDSQRVYKSTVTTQASDKSKIKDTSSKLSSSSAVVFTGLMDHNGNMIKSYVVGEYQGSGRDDSYGEFNYHMMIVPLDTDLSDVAPTFTTATGVKLYAAGSNAPEESGKSYHDISNGTLHYTASAEDGIAAKNYWLQIIKASGEEQSLFINSLNDQNAHTEIRDGVIYSTREIMMDSYHKNHHDIFLANTGSQDIKNLNVELVSDTVVLDKYWTFDGNYDLKGINANTTDTYDVIPENIAKIRLVAKDGVNSGDISGTLTIKSGTTVLMVLTLTGSIGDPEITTTEIPAAVKYVPYGTMVQNNNKYSWNQIRYSYSGMLPEGMTIKENGEIYGVPREAGEYTFTVRMYCNGGNTSTRDEKTYTLKVLDNTNENVENATDAGYNLKERVQTVYLGSIPTNSDDRLAYMKNNKQRMVSQGEYDEYVAVYLDGQKLVEGKDYTSEAGSTRITLTYQTLLRNMTSSNNRTLAIEFREKGTDTLKRAAQNFEVSNESGSNTNVGDGGNNSNSGNNQNDGSNSNGGNNQNNGSNSNGGNNQNNGSNSNGGNNQNDGSNSNSGNNQNDGSNSNGGSSSGSGDSAGSGSTAEDSVVISAGTIQTMTYTVQPGDTLSKIAKKFLGSASEWRRIYQDNEAIIKNPNIIRVGQKLVINLSGKTTTVSSNATAINANTYVVQPGDNLWKIAKKVYGQGFVWRKIFDANSNVVSNPGNIHVGQVLLIP